MKKYLPALSCMVFLAACSTPKIALNGDGFTEMPVKGRNGFFIRQKLSFGTYTTGAVKRSWTKGNFSRTGFGTYQPDGSFDNIVSMEYSRKKQTVNFDFTDGQQTSEVRCVTKFNSEDLVVGNNRNSLPNIIIELARGMQTESSYYVQVFTGEQRPWQLLLDNNAVQARPKKYQGVFALNNEHFYTIIPVNKMLNKKGEAKNILFGSIGLELRNKENKSVATVSFLDKGKVYLNTSDKKEAFLLANVCAALLLQQQIDS